MPTERQHRPFKLGRASTLSLPFGHARGRSRTRFAPSSRWAKQTTAQNRFSFGSRQRGKRQGIALRVFMYSRAAGYSFKQEYRRGWISRAFDSKAASFFFFSPFFGLGKTLTFRKRNPGRAAGWDGLQL